MQQVGITVLLPTHLESPRVSVRWSPRAGLGSGFLVVARPDGPANDTAGDDGAVWEISIKATLGRLKIDEDLADTVATEGLAAKSSLAEARNSSAFERYCLAWTSEIGLVLLVL